MGKYSKHTSRSARTALMALSVGLASLGFMTTANASKFGVRVIDEQGEPVAGIAVCVGMEGNYKQFGALFTNSDGTAMVDVPNVPLVVTVSRNRFTGTRMSEPARQFNLIKEVTLTEGVPGPRCSAGSSLVANPPRIEISDVVVAEGTYSTTLEPQVSGEPSHYRVSTKETFDDTEWQRFKAMIALSAPLSAEQSIFLQMRRISGTTSSWVEARSEIVNVRLPVR